ncbi:oxygen-independent coproporphyrinogen III oxidase [Qipengyuania vesicularis]|uniref:oxygen-independent coproporphyrinogen III oxidase n=1 Tax=Qipengyuania vesicularis TaxID=2867232 RepID=UPI001C88C835|nr:oxygen-independent coproporphyrinogen III oxidase [Qipengyuania vesicularis]MBX7526380.1 oxygen-independent coproporphyrinogen III oxidase [Qipengyuania vesicularis]
MWTYYPELLAKPVPRYTSYPTAAEFGDLDPDRYRQALRNAEGDISLYIHIPFCEKICFYCGCNTAHAGRKQRLESYLDALHAEIELVASLLPPTALVRRIAFGGGSPNAIEPDQFRLLVDKLFFSFATADPVLSIELDPRTMTSDWAEAIGHVGIQRASLGVQTFAPHCQQAIGRVQDEDCIVRTVDWLREAGVTSLNFDLMYGLPGQTMADLEDSLQRTRVLGADRVALFGYAHVPHIVPRQRVIDASELPDQEQRFAMAELGYAYFATHGYTPIGFDHFARPGGDPLARAAFDGTLRRNFQGFTDDTSDVLVGLGASAISSFPHLLAQNEKNSGRYRMLSSQDHLAANRGILRTADDRYRGAVIEQLLCQGRAQLGACLMREVRPSLQPFLDRGLVDIDRQWLDILPEGLPYARTIAALFDAHRAATMQQFSSAV